MELSASEMDAQLEPSARPPSAGQRSHWYSKVSGVAPFQLPTLALRNRPRTNVPVIVGSTVFTGGPTVVDCVTVSVGFDTAAAAPALFDAVTWTRSRRPMSSPVSV